MTQISPTTSHTLPLRMKLFGTSTYFARKYSHKFLPSPSYVLEAL